MVSKSRAGQSRLDQVLARQLDSVTARAIESNTVSEADIQSLERLSRLAELGRSSNNRRRWRLVAVATVCAGAALATALGLARIGSMEVSIDASVSSLTFGAARNGTTPIISASIPLARFEAAGLGGATVPTSTAHQRLVTREPYFSVEVTNVARGGGIELQPRTASGGTTVSLRVGDREHIYHMHVTGDSGEYQLVVSGQIAVAAPQTQIITIPPDRPRLVRLTAGTAGVDFELELPPGTHERLLVATTEVDSLSLFQDVQLGDALGGRTFQLSSVDSASVTFASVDRDELTLRRGETLWLLAPHGRIHNLRLNPDGISFRFQGRVHGLQMGAGSVQRNLMPTWMEWLSARAVIPFAWGATLYLLGIVLAVLRWWAKPE